MHDGMPNSAGPLRIRGFGDVDFRSHRTGGRPNTFSVGAIDLFLSSKLNDHFTTLGELNFEADESNQWGIDAERMLLQYVANDYLTIAAGRYHTAIGYYNAAYHHGTWLQTAIGRPFIFYFEDQGGLLPVHGVGVSAQGRLPSGAAGLRWIAEIGNGRRSTSLADEPVQNLEDENAHKAFNLALVARPDGAPGLQTGFSVYRDRLMPTGRAAIGETILAAHLVYKQPTIEFLNEVLFVRHSPENAGTTTTSAFYSQFSRKFGRYRPYARYEFLDVPTTDAFYGSAIGRLRGPVVGLKYDPADPVTLKLQFTWFSGPARDRFNGVTAQLAFTF
jgi:hypothetical protein